MYQDNADGPNVDLYRQNFLDAVDYSELNKAVYGLVLSLNGEKGYFGCDLLEILYSGDAAGNYWKGWENHLVMQSSYVFSLINLGISLQASYVTFRDNSDTAYRAIETMYEDDIVTIIDRIEEWA
jgi:hypothetical protein